jgi:hypothetical protein
MRLHINELDSIISVAREASEDIHVSKHWLLLLSLLTQKDNANRYFSINIDEIWNV